MHDADAVVAALQQQVERAEMLFEELAACHRAMLHLLNEQGVRTKSQLLSPDGIPDQAAHILAERGPLKGWDIFEALGGRNRYRFTSQPLSVIANRLKNDKEGRFVYDKPTKRWALLGEGDGAAREG